MRWYQTRSHEEDASLSQRLARELTFPGETFVVVLNDGNARLKKIMRQIAGSQIYPL
jgi:hypothetical protein